jgi:prepilin peptidase CpaA
VFGPTNPLISQAITVIAIIAVITDLALGKIYNWLTLPAIVAGLIAGFALHGGSGLLSAFVGVLLGLALYGWMFLIGVMGGGDVKLLMAFGAWGGAGVAIETSLLGVLLGGVMAAVIMLATGRIVSFSKRIYHFLLTLFVKELVYDFPKIDRKFTMPYGVPLSAAAVWVVWAHPLVAWFESFGVTR